MATMLSVSWVFLTLTIGTGWAKIKVYEEPQHVKELKRFTSELENTLGSPYYTIGVSGTNRSCSRDVSEGLFKWSQKGPFMISNEKGEQKVAMVVHFLDDIKEIDNILPLENHGAKMFFILCNPAHKTSWIKDSGKKLWSKNIIDFFFIYYTTQVEVVTYNVFAANKIINYTNTPVVYSKLFDTKTRNLNGYPLYIHGNKSMKSSRKGKGNNRDTIVIRDILKHINASLTSIPSNRTKGRRGFKSFHNLSLITRYMRDLDNDSRKSDFTYPFNLDACVVIVPKGKPINPYMNLVYTLQIEVWISLLVTLMCIIGTLYVIDKVSDCPGQEDPVLQTARVITSLPSLGLKQSVASKKCLIIFMLWFSVLISTAFHSSLMNALIKDRYGKDINTLQELEDSKLKIIISKELAEMVPKESNLHKQFVTKRGQSKSFSKINTSYAYVLSSIEMDTHSFFNITKKFKVVEEYLVPGLKAYEFPKGSPYLQIVDKFLAMYHEHGLIQHIRVKRENATADDDVLKSGKRFATSRNHYKTLTLFRLQAPFYILLIGYSLSVVALLFEILIHKCYGKKV